MYTLCRLNAWGTTKKEKLAGYAALVEPWPASYPFIDAAQTHSKVDLFVLLQRQRRAACPRWGHPLRLNIATTNYRLIWFPSQLFYSEVRSSYALPAVCSDQCQHGICVGFLWIKSQHVHFLLSGVRWGWRIAQIGITLSGYVESNKKEAIIGDYGNEIQGQMCLVQIRGVFSWRGYTTLQGTYILLCDR